MPNIARPTKPLADVNVQVQKDGSVEVVVCFMPDVDSLVGEGDSRAVLALDASRSIKERYGGGGIFDPKPNYVQGVARKLGEILCSVTRTGKVSMLYWAMGPGGGDTEIIGDLDEAACGKADISGPKKKNSWGTGTKMLPAIKYVCETVGKSAEFTMGVIITDGIIEDETDCMKYCMQIGKDIVDGKRKTIKLVLIGVGVEVNEEQLQRFNDMFEPTPLKGKIDLWAAGVAADIKEEADIIGILFGELMSEETIVAATAKVVAGGKVVANFSDGLPGKFRFNVPKGCKEFSIQTPKGEVTQDISEAL